MIYFEYLSLPVFIIFLFKFNTLKKLFGPNSNSIYFIDISFLADRFLIPIIGFFGKKVSRLNFRLTEIVDDNGELISLRIRRKDLFEVQKKIIDSQAYKSLFHESWNQDSILDYINEGIVDGGINSKKPTVSKVLFILEVVSWHMKKINIQNSYFIINKLPWFNIYKNIAVDKKITLLELYNIKFEFNLIKKIIRNNFWLYGIVKNLKYQNFFRKKDKIDSSKNMVYLEGRGDVVLVNDGTHSDFFWQFNSDFPKKNILYKYHSNFERKSLNKYGISPVPEGVVLNVKNKRNYLKPKNNNVNFFQKKENKLIHSILASYDLDRFYWSAFFKFYNVKIYLTWHKYSNDHIALYDAINDNGGIHVIWQIGFDGFKFKFSMMKADINFCHSHFSALIEKKINSKINYNVITGYPKDYTPPLLKKRARNLRKKLKQNGAKKIVFVIDENSTNDNRWHTGHELQQENYKYILEKLLETSWLGVIFKPKNAKTLAKRLGPVAELLSKAKKTGRCFIYEYTTRHTTTASPALAALSSDICINSHLAAGTAAIECALTGIPTLLIDREGTPFSKLNELPKDKVIFKDWISTINAVIKHFNTPGGINGFGDWSSIIDDLDPFRDGKAANRIGTYLHWLMQGYNQGLDKHTVMLTAANKYKKRWGDDKVIIN